MREFHHGKRLGHLAVALFTIGAGLGAAGPIHAAPPPGLAGIPRCASAGEPGAGRSGPQPGFRVRTRLDAGGAVAGVDVGMGGGHRIGLGATGFADGPFGAVAVVGERDAIETRIALLDLGRRCAFRRATLPALVYGSRFDPASGQLHVSLVEPGSRRELGIWRIDPDPAARPQLVVAPPAGSLATAVPRTGGIAWDRGPVGRWCAAGWCQERRTDGSLRVSVDDGIEPDLGAVGDPTPAVVAPRPVPQEDVARWAKNEVLTYRWHGTETPPAWIRPGVNAAAEDVRESRRSKSPTFVFDSAATDTIRYTNVFPAASCATAIACASYAIPDSWTIRIRPHGTDFRWGVLRWCQAADRDGCFDIERVMIHEFGHIVGLDHPEDGGFALNPGDSVMHRLAPSQPRAGWAIHSFRPCDVATLQERYDTGSATTPISTCNDVDTTLTLVASSVSVVRPLGTTLTATLRIVDRDAYGQLGGNRLSDRVVHLRRRPLGSTGEWTVFTMRPGDADGEYQLTLLPSTSYELQAVFPAPDNEGLHTSASSVISVRVTGGCTSTCAASEDPMS